MADSAPNLACRAGQRCPRREPQSRGARRAGRARAPRGRSRRLTGRRMARGHPRKGGACGGLAGFLFFAGLRLLMLALLVDPMKDAAKRRKLVACDLDVRRRRVRSHFLDPPGRERIDLRKLLAQSLGETQRADHLGEPPSALIGARWLMMPGDHLGNGLRDPPARKDVARENRVVVAKELALVQVQRVGLSERLGEHRGVSAVSRVEHHENADVVQQPARVHLFGRQTAAKREVASERARSQRVREKRGRERRVAKEPHDRLRRRQLNRLLVAEEGDCDTDVAALSRQAECRRVDRLARPCPRVQRTRPRSRTRCRRSPAAMLRRHAVLAL